MLNHTQLVACVTVVLLAGCSLDYNEAVPCETSDQCAPNFVCDPAIGRCVSGQSGLSDVDPDLAQDAGDDDSDVDQPDTPVDTADRGGDPDNGTPDTPVEDTGNDSGGGDACIPNAEVCNGIDDNCNDEADEGLDCGTCPDADNMALVVRPGPVVFCIDVYEASRPDASLASQGSDETMAAAQRAVLPWNDVSLADAGAACTNAGKRLCTALEWAEACGGINSWNYPYDITTYNPDACNGSDAAVGSFGATASRFLCESPEGPLDMSGNLEEWVQEGTSHGGSFSDMSLELRCNGTGEMPDQATPGTAVGFRCCADTVAE